MRYKEFIVELRGIKQDLANAPYPGILLQNGFKQIGTGGAASVWEHPDLDYVLKVFDNKDHAYMEWVDTCLYYRNNPCLPKFVSPRIFRLNDKLNYVRMEKLTPAATTYGRLCLEIYDAVEKLSKDDEDEYDDEGFNIRNYPAITNYLQKCPSLLNTIRMIAQMIEQGHGENDCNASNIMLRGDQIVITDPLRHGW